jgi:hypothetical protein
MKSHALRLYVFSISLLLFFVLWAVIAARPWAARSGASRVLDPLAARERHLKHEARVVEQTVRRRWAAYRRRLHAREAQIRALERRHAALLAAANAAAATTASYSAAAPASRVVTLPPQVRVVTLPPAGPSTTSGSSHP